MIQAIYVRVRYDTPDEGDEKTDPPRLPETRRDRNERFGHPEHNPPFLLPEIGLYLWDWYFSISNRLRRVIDGICVPIPPTEFIAWRIATGTIVYPREYEVLCAMDQAYCEEMNKELADYRERQKEANKRP